MSNLKKNVFTITEYLYEVYMQGGHSPAYQGIQGK